MSKIIGKKNIKLNKFSSHLLYRNILKKKKKEKKMSEGSWKTKYFLLSEGN